MMCAAGAALAARVRPVSAQAPTSRYGYPIRLPERLPGDGLVVRHGYACENTWYNPGWWHTGEDWYAIEGNTAIAEAVAIAEGEVVFAGSDYPGRVVIVQHEAYLYSMYGHLGYELPVGVGDPVEPGQVLGPMLARDDGRAPSHLHFEVRTFLTTSEVNGDAPRYGYGCGFDCPPGPGYWPIDAPEHPSALGWRNPTHVIARRAFPDGEVPEGTTVVAAADGTVETWSAPEGSDGAEQLGELEATNGDGYDLLAVAAGPEASEETSAEAYAVWYELAVPNGEPVWVRAVVAEAGDTGSDGRPSSVQFAFLPSSDR
jgi:murein DD-endopeptidase MepM/ murein hydrolase activator NlpD